MCIRDRNSSLIQEIRNVQFQDKFPTNVSPVNLDPRCNFQSKKIVCNFGNWQAKFRENFEITIQNNNGKIIDKKINPNWIVFLWENLNQSN